jgi:hypothetical protein
MPIVVDSSQWTGEHDDAPMASPVVWGEFAEAAELDQVAERLQAESWYRDSLAGPAPEAAQPGAADNEAQVDAPDDDPKGADRRNLRQNFVGTATAATSMAAAGIVIATGGAALPAVAAAAAAGGATLAAGEAAGAAVPESGTGRRPEGQEALRAEGPSLGITAGTQALREQAKAFLQQAGAKRVWVQETPAG